jgi:hypothetical protein
MQLDRPRAINLDFERLRNERRISAQNAVSYKNALESPVRPAVIALAQRRKHTADAPLSIWNAF